MSISLKLLFEVNLENLPTRVARLPSPLANVSAVSTWINCSSCRN